MNLTKLISNENNKFDKISQREMQIETNTAHRRRKRHNGSKS